MIVHYRGTGGACGGSHGMFAPDSPKTKAPTRAEYSAVLAAKLISDEVLDPFARGPKCTTKVELTLSCKNLVNMDIVTKSDPYCIVSMKESWQQKYAEITRTETIIDSLNPEWVTKVIVSYNFETLQDMKFQVRDEDLVGTYDSLGYFETTLSDIVAYSGRRFTGKLIGPSNRNYGEIVIVSEEVTSCKEIYEIQFRGENLRKTSFFRSIDSFLVIYRSNEDDSFSVVARTGTVQSSQNPTWKSLVMRSRTLCNGDLDRCIKIDCFDRRRNGNHELIGSCFTTLRTLQTMPLSLARKPKKQPAGNIYVEKFNVATEYTFLDYIRNGTQIHFAVAIDFTVSNEVYTNPKSLHYLREKGLNPYEIALTSLGQIIEHYDTSFIFPAFGFGAKLPNGEISFQFPLNGNVASPYCKGVKEILQHYRNTLKTVELYGPTNFAPVIYNTISIAKQYQDGNHYFVLLIITDGIISDMRQTKHAIIDASSLPISIIIVGVGSSGFRRMDQLDSDHIKLAVDGREAARDIVQFVPLNKFLSTEINSPLKINVRHRPGSDLYTHPQSNVKSQAALAKEVLCEIPYQLTSFMQSRNLRPQLKHEVAPNPSAIIPTAPMIDIPSAPMLDEF